MFARKAAPVPTLATEMAITACAFPIFCSAKVSKISFFFSPNACARDNILKRVSLTLPCPVLGRNIWKMFFRRASHRAFRGEAGCCWRAWQGMLKQASLQRRKETTRWFNSFVGLLLRCRLRFHRCTGIGCWWIHILTQVSGAISGWSFVQSHVDVGPGWWSCSRSGLRRFRPIRRWWCLWRFHQNYRQQWC